PQVFLGLAFNWGALLAWAAHAGEVALPAIVLYLSGIVWTLFYDTIYAHQDKEDDALIGVKSTARLFGDNTYRWLRIFLVIAIVFLGVAVVDALVLRGNPLALVVAFCGAWAFGWHLMWQMTRVDIDDPDNCLRFFRSNRDAGLIVALFFAVAAFL
ncbi:MAG: UbiA family prenyltransferase, partial [Alphaproteobacteria bacterium]|nr:UbiA family prenyltransferase [Alphaproteobacteria bacterium]